MSALTWSDALALQHTQMDHTHQEFVALLGVLDSAVGAPQTEVLLHLERFIEHTQAHFGQEDAWMASMGFEPENCHVRQHQQVLQLLHEVRRRVRDEGQTALIAELVPALAEWFVPHAHNMDGALAQVMLETGFDPATGRMSRPLGAAAVPGDGAALNAAATPVSAG